MTERDDNRLVEYLYDELPEREAKAFERSLDGDATLARDAQELRGVLDSLRALPDEEPPRDLDSLILAHARELAERQNERVWWRRLLSTPLIGVAAAAATAAVVAIVALPSLDRAPEPQMIGAGDHVVELKPAVVPSNGVAASPIAPEAAPAQDPQARSESYPPERGDGELGSAIGDDKKDEKLRAKAILDADQPNFRDATRGGARPAKEEAYAEFPGGEHGDRGERKGQQPMKPKATHERAPAPAPKDELDSGRVAREAPATGRAAGGEAGGGGLLLRQSAQKPAEPPPPPAEKLAEAEDQERSKRSDSAPATADVPAPVATPSAEPPAPSPARARAPAPAVQAAPPAASETTVEPKKKAELDDNLASADAIRRADRLVQSKKIAEARQLLIEARAPLTGRRGYFMLTVRLARLELEDRRFIAAIAYAREARGSSDPALRAEAERIQRESEGHTSPPAASPPR